MLIFPPTINQSCHEINLKDQNRKSLRVYFEFPLFHGNPYTTQTKKVWQNRVNSFNSYRIVMKVTSYMYMHAVNYK